MSTQDQSELGQLLEEGRRAVSDASDLAALDAVRVAYLGKKGRLTEQLKALGKLPPEQRPEAGQAINRAKQALQQDIDARREALERAKLEQALEAERIDVSLPGRGQSVGGLHPITRTI